MNRCEIRSPSKSRSLNRQDILGFDDPADGRPGSSFFIS